MMAGSYRTEDGEMIWKNGLRTIYTHSLWRQQTDWNGVRQLCMWSTPTGTEHLDLDDDDYFVRLLMIKSSHSKLHKKE